MKLNCPFKRHFFSLGSSGELPAQYSYFSIKATEIVMKYLVIMLLITQFALFARTASAQAVPFSASAYNWDNSPNNFNNSPYNWQNSPYNYNNSANNFNATNGVYDNKGNRLAYEVQAPTGVTNYFDNSGNRIGYTPSRRQ